MPRRLKNIRKWKGGLQAYTQIHGKTVAKSFPLSTPIEEMREWIQTQRALRAGPVLPRGSFAADIAEYLSRVTSLVTYEQRTQHLEMWAHELGHDRPRRTITPTEIDCVLQTWLLQGLSPSTVRKRRMALRALWNRLDGNHAQNPVRATIAPREPKPEVRGLPYDVIAQILAAMRPGASRSRIAVMAWTGLPPGMVGDIGPADLNLLAETLRVRPRRKGAGVEARTLPLLPQAVEELRTFDQIRAYGKFSIPSLNQFFVRACLRVDPPVRGVSLYDLRHSFGSMLYRVTKDLATVSRFLLHANVAMSQRYAAGALVEVDRAAATQAGMFLSLNPVPRDKT